MELHSALPIQQDWLMGCPQHKKLVSENMISFLICLPGGERLRFGLFQSELGFCPFAFYQIQFQLWQLVNYTSKGKKKKQWKGV